MATQHPVHPDDVKQLLKIRRYLIGYRKTNGWSQPELSQMINGTKGMAWDLESNVTWQWRFSRLQDWCSPFGLRLSARLRFPDDPGLEERVHEHPEVAPVYSLSQGEGAWKKWQRFYLTQALSIARKDLQIPTETMAKFLGVSRKAVWGWEATAEEAMLPKVLHYARLLGGFIELELVEENSGQ